MGRLSRWVAAVAAAFAMILIGADAAAAFDGFGTSRADAIFGGEISFEVELDGTPPERLELLTRTPESEAWFVNPVEPDAGTARFVWDTSHDFVRPNTVISYQWRATSGEDVTLGPVESILHDDDRPEFDWREAQLGEATVHWYGDAEAQARQIGGVTAGGVEGAEALLGSQLAGPVDVFVYADGEDFFGALGPGTREWTGAAAVPELRTIYMRLDAGTLDTIMIHEVTHIVFFDATLNPYHRPARWLNEGFATWSEFGNAGSSESLVQFEAGSESGLFAFDAITRQFPIGERGAQLSYSQGATMIELIIERFGSEAIARIAAAYREGATDAEALEAGTGIGADELYATYFAEFGVEAPEPIAPTPIGPSTVERPPAVGADGGNDADPGTPNPNAPQPAGPDPDAAPAADRQDSWPLLAVLGAAGLLVMAAAVVVARRASRRAA